MKRKTCLNPLFISEYNVMRFIIQMKTNKQKAISHHKLTIFNFDKSIQDPLPNIIKQILRCKVSCSCLSIICFYSISHITFHHFIKKKQRRNQSYFFCLTLNAKEPFFVLHVRILLKIYPVISEWVVWSNFFKTSTRVW